MFVAGIDAHATYSVPQQSLVRRLVPKQRTSPGVRPEPWPMSLELVAPTVSSISGDFPLPASRGTDIPC